MKNFRKVLALVLVVATLFSFTAMTSAKTYTDDADISYKEAVAVLSHVGILNGYEDDSFKPTASITREEMAKMIAVLANAGDDVSALYAPACSFADVAKDRWSASYVAYCAKTGIVAGRSATTFDPKANVTGLETAKMLLVVLGFNAEAQGYVGADWKINVLRDAKVMGLLSNFAAGYDVEANITREQAAQMMLNALEAPCVVGILSNKVVTLTNALVFDETYVNDPSLKDLVDVATYAKLKDALNAGKWALYGNVVISDDLLLEKLYNLTKKTTEDADCYGRPSTTWYYEKTNGTTAKFALAANAPIFESYNTTASKVKNALKAYSGEGTKYTFTTWVDGKEVVTNQDLDTAIDGMKQNNIPVGKGTVVEAYVNDKEVVIVVINTYIAQITKVNTASFTFEIADVNGKVVSGYNFANSFGLTTADAGEYALVWLCNDYQAGKAKLHDIKIVEPTVAKITDASTVKGAAADSYFLAAGDKYEYASTFEVWLKDNVAGVVGDAGAYVGKTADIYTDENGFVMYITEHEDTEYFYAVIDNESVERTQGVTTNAGTKFTYTANLVEFAANPAPGEDIVASASFFGVDKNNNADNRFDYDTLVKYYIDAQGRAQVVDAVKGLEDELEAYTEADYTLTGEQEANKTLSKYSADTTLGATVTADTQILLRVYDYMTGKHVYKYFDGKNDVDATYTLSHAQYFKKGSVITYLYAEAAYAGAANDAFVLGYSNSYMYLTEGNEKVAYNLYNALVNGEPALVAYQEQLPIVKTDAKGNAVYFNVYSADLVCIGIQAKDGTPIYKTAAKQGTMVPEQLNTGVTVSGDTLIWAQGVADLAETCKIIVAFPETWNHDNDDGTTAKIKYIPVDSNKGLNYYAETYGWDHGYVWFDDTDADGYEDVLYVCAAVAVDTIG